ncbi:hypothetical protein CA606_09325 [Caulobacter vibrioides]|uniref:Peptidase S1 domain-containing protein n=1 Tax=Caulobacter vibrioides TaxID=155892 RepID=A0A290MKJ7_CAUVI|nr:trypsin-like serine protease [Caulobacter vibrioides]ATC32531.1 hypothetical protein CA606_09325 [Caulobacter vibrioides]
MLRSWRARASTSFGSMAGVVLVLGLVVPCFAQDAPRPIRFRPLSDVVDSNAIQVFGGKQPSAGDWSSIVVANSADGAAEWSCSATLVGPRVLLTAAHCVDSQSGKARPLIITLDDGEIQFDCQIDQVYTDSGNYSTNQPRGVDDYALCALSPKTKQRPARYDLLAQEIVDLEPLEPSNAVLITGYGCTAMKVDLDAGDIVHGPFSQVFNIGDELVDSVSAYSVRTNSKAAKEPALCQGDSGGPLFSGATTANPTAKRFVRGVNSKVSAATGQLISTMAALSSPNFRAYLACWQKSNGAFRVAVKDPNLVPKCAAT